MAFTGQLNSNEIFAGMFNMIISQQMTEAAIKGSALVDQARVDGGLYGDTKLYYSADVLKSYQWLNDAEAANLLALNRPADPECQAIGIDNFRQIRLTVDNYLSKRAWGSEYSFALFTNQMLSFVGETKKVYDQTTYDAFIGTTESSVGKQSATIDVTTAVGSATGEEANRLEATAIAEGIASIIEDMTLAPSRDYNDYGFLRRHAKEDIMVIWNSAFATKILKIDLPTIYHKDGLLDISNVMHAKYFGTVNAAATAGNGTTIRSLIEQDIGSNHYFAGDLIKATDTAPAGTSYTQSDNVICKIVLKGKLPPLMSAFEVGTSFFNARSLTENRYLTWGINELEYLKGYPFVTVKKI